MFSAFVQDTFTIAEGIRITAGTKLEHNHFSGFEIQPSVRFSWAPNANHTLWAGVSRAVQTPSRLDRGMFLEGVFAIPAPPPIGPMIANLVGSENTRSSDLLAFEAGYRVRPHPEVLIEIAAFFNRYEDTTEVTMGEPTFGFYQGQPALIVPAVIENRGSGDSYGAEVSMRWRPRDWIELNAFYSVIDLNLSTPDASNLTPHHTAHLRASFDPLEELQINTAFHYTDVVPLTGVPSYLRWDLNIQWQIDDTFRAGAGVQNLLDDHHPESRPRSTPAWEVTRLFWISLEARF